MRYYPRFLGAIPHQRVRSYALLTRPPLSRRGGTVRLACLRHAASVYPEPGSNSQEISYHILNVKMYLPYLFTCKRAKVNEKSRPSRDQKIHLSGLTFYIIFQNLNYFISESPLKVNTLKRGHHPFFTANLVSSTPSSSSLLPS